MSRYTLDRLFDQEWFDELKREAHTVSTALRLSGDMPGRLHQKNVIIAKLRMRIEMIEKHGEHYSLFKGSKIFYTLNNLKAYIDAANKFLEGGKA